MRLLLGLTRWAAYVVAWLGSWAGLGVVLTWRSFRQHQRTVDVMPSFDGFARRLARS